MGTMIMCPREFDVALCSIIVNNAALSFSLLPTFVLEANYSTFQGIFVILFALHLRAFREWNKWNTC